jgi:hypothetical protein
MGDTPVPKLKRLPDKLGGGGYVGRLVDMHASMAMWLAEESKRELGGLDIITDRLVFAARALAPIAQLRDKWIGLASEMADLTLAAKKKYDSEMRGSSSTRTPEPAPKRHAGMTPRVIRGDPFFPGHQELVSSKAAGCDSKEELHLTRRKRGGGCSG